MSLHCFARSYIQFHLKKEVSWHLSTSTGKWPCRRRRRRRAVAAAFSVSVELSHFHWWCNTILTSISASRLLRHCVGSSKIKIVQDRRQPASGKYIKLVYYRSWIIFAISYLAFPGVYKKTCFNHINSIFQLEKANVLLWHFWSQAQVLILPEPVCCKK